MLGEQWKQEQEDIRQRIAATEPMDRDLGKWGQLQEIHSDSEPAIMAAVFMVAENCARLMQA